MEDTISHLYSLLAIVNIHLRPFPHHGHSCDHVVRLPRTTGGTPPPNCATSIHNRRGGAGILERHEKHSPRRSGESDQPPARKEIIGPFGSQNLTVDLRRMYLTTRDLTSWSQPYRDDKCTKQLHSVWILPVNNKRIMNRHARRIDPRVDKLASETHGPSCSDYRVTWDFDSPWITGPMTAHHSVAYVRHIKLAPAANLCTLSAIVFLPIKAWIWRHIRRYLDGSAIFCWLSQRTRMTQMTKDFVMRHEEIYVEWNGISIKWYQFVTNFPYHQTIYSKHNICSFEFLFR